MPFCPDFCYPNRKFFRFPAILHFRKSGVISISRRPFSWLLLAILSGILSGTSGISLITFYKIIFVIVAILVISGRRIRFRGSLLALTFAAGFFLGMMEKSGGKDHVSQLAGKAVMLEFDISQPIRKTEKGCGVIGQCRAPASGSVAIQWKMDPGESENPTAVRCHGILREIESGRSGFHDYLIATGTRNVMVCDSLIEWEGTPINRLSSACRNALTAMYLRIIPDPENAALMAAMMTGDRNGISRETKTEFSNSGIAHLISISGLHVSIIYLSLMSVFRFFSRDRKTRQAAAVLAMILLVLFTLITGSGPAVMRATFMICCFVISGMMRRKSDPLNVLCFSAFVLLVCNPGLIYDPGFQLSYLAVAGIILLNPPIAGIVVLVWPRLPAQIAELISVSLAAQFATAPLAWLQFGSFPTYFLITNMIAIPLAALAVRIGFFAFAAGFVPELGPAIGNAMNLLMDAIRVFAEFVSNIPGAVIMAADPLPGLRGLAATLLLMSGAAILPGILRDLPPARYVTQGLRRWNTVIDFLSQSAHHAFSFFKFN